MAKPDIKITTNGYQLQWIGDQITIEVSRIHTHTDGRVTGEIFIRNGAKALKPPSQFNFGSDRTRDGLVKSLAETYQNKADWRKIVDELCYHVLILVREGEPVIEIHSGAEVTPPEFILEPFIIKNYPSVIYGDPGSIKSTLALIFSQVISLPWHDNPLDLCAPRDSHRVLYLDWETDKATLEWQLTMIENGTGNGCFIHYRRCSLPLAHDTEAIKKQMVDLEIDTVILDSLGLATGGELKEAGPVLAFFGALRQLNTTSLILAHSPKDNENTKNKTIYGSVFFQAQARNVWEIRKSQEQGSPIADIALYHRKPAPFQHYHSPIGYRLEYTGNSLAIVKNDPCAVPEFVAKMGPQAQIINCLKDGALSAQEIDDLTGIGKNVNKYLSDMKKAGKVINLERGLWGLPY